jgi:TonB-linked SusC/RagA family outer membrane protein
MKYSTYRPNTLPLFLLMLGLTFGIAKAQSVDTDTDSIHRDRPVRIGYNNSLPAWMVNGAVSVASSSDLSKSISTNFGSFLHGKIAGLTVTQSANEPGYEPRGLYSRGIGTFGQSNILIIVDGFESFYDQLALEEVESVTLLKDAASTAMYGAKGANGVLLITTKRGKEGPLKIDFTVQSGIETPLRLPEFSNSYDYARLYNEALANDRLPAQYTDADLEAYQTGSDPYLHPDVNWHEQLLRKVVPVTKYNLTFTGGLNRVRYFVYLGGVQQSGLYEKTKNLSEFTINSRYMQHNLRANVDIDLSDRLTASVNLGYAVSNKQNPAGIQTNAVFGAMSLIPPNAFPIRNPDSSYGGTAVFTNPWGNLLETGMYTSNYRTTNTALKLTHQLDMIAEGLSIAAAGSFNNTFMGQSLKSRNYARFSISENNSGDVVYNQFGTPTSLASNESSYGQWRNTVFQAFLNYNREIGDDHKIDASFGYDLNSITETAQLTDFRHVGFNGRVSYSNRQKYIGELAMGYYGANGYKKGSRFGMFPGVSLGWIISREGFLQENDLLDYLKLKASFGISGNNYLPNSDRFMYHQYYAGQGSYVFGTSTFYGYGEHILANPDLSWEKKREWNIGFDATLLNRLTVNLDMFWQNRYDILASPIDVVPQFFGIYQPRMNLGKVANKGFEIQIGYRSERMGDVNFFANLSIWYARNKITSIPEVIRENEYEQQEGKRVGQPFMLESIGFFKDEPDVQGSSAQIFDIVQAGDLKYKDQNNDRVIDERDLYPIGYTQLPELSSGLNIGVDYKNFYFSTFFHAVTNRTVYLSGSDFYAFQNNGKISSIALDRWTSSTHHSAKYPRLSSKNNANNYRNSSFWQRDGSFIKLRNVELGYRLPKSLLNRLGLKEATLFISGANLLTFDRVKIADPEILSGYPAMRAFTAGAKIQL